MTAGGLNSGPSGPLCPLVLGIHGLHLSPGWRQSLRPAQTGRLVHMTGLSHGGHPRALGLGDRNSCTSTPEGLNCLFPSEVRIERIFSEFPVLPFVNILLLLKLTYIPCRGISRTEARTGECAQCWGISEGCSAKSWAPRANDEFKSGIWFRVTLGARLSLLL